MTTPDDPNARVEFHPACLSLSLAIHPLLMHCDRLDRARSLKLDAMANAGLQQAKVLEDSSKRKKKEKKTKGASSLA